jgi:hypothetical protein
VWGGGEPDYQHIHQSVVKAFRTQSFVTTNTCSRCAKDTRFEIVFLEYAPFSVFLVGTA